MRARTANLPPVLTVLPVELMTARSPVRCLCVTCSPGLTDEQRADVRRQVDTWAAARRSWCTANGYSSYELLVAEEAARLRAVEAES